MDNRPGATPRPTGTPPPAPTRRRADAERSITAILDAAVTALADDSHASMTTIATRAGVVRATVYMHFPTRGALLEAVTGHAVTEVSRAIAEARPDQGAAAAALSRVLGATWQALSRFHNLVSVNSTLPAADLRKRLRPATDQLRPLIERGRASGDFGTDVPVTWQLAVVVALVHALNAEVQMGNVPAEDGPRLLTSTAAAALAPAR